MTTVNAKRVIAALHGLSAGVALTTAINTGSGYAAGLVFLILVAFLASFVEE